MAVRRVLDPHLLNKVAEKTGKTEQYIREQVSRRASSRHTTSAVELIKWARDFNLGNQRALKNLSGDELLMLSNAQPRSVSTTTRIIKTVSRTSGDKNPDGEIFKLSPEFYGLGINLRAAWNKVRNLFRKSR
jgi:hypothetical protein